MNQLFKQIANLEIIRNTLKPLQKTLQLIFVQNQVVTAFNKNI